jgi:hypothetical protein
MNQSDTNTYGLQHTYLLGDDLLTAVIITNLATTRTVYLPAGNWYDFFTQRIFVGGRNITWSNADQTRTPLFVREGAMIPMISTNVLSLCDAGYIGNPGITTWDGSLQFLIYPTTNSSVTVYDGTRLHCRTSGHTIRFSLLSQPRPVTMKIFSDRPLRVECDGMRLHHFISVRDFDLAARGWFYDGQFVQVKFQHAGGSSRIMVQGNNSTR